LAGWIETEITTKVSPRSVTDTISRLTGILSASGLKVFTVIDQSAEASQVGLQLRDTTLVLFGSPAAGTPVMVAAPWRRWTCRSRYWSAPTMGRRRSPTTPRPRSPRVMT